MDNSAGGAGARSVIVKRGVFRFDNSAAHAVAAANLGALCFVEFDNQVGSVPGANNVVAGRVVDVDADGVWVETGRS